MNKIKRILAVCLLAVTATSAFARGGFAIVIDPKSYNEAKTEVDAYANAITKYNNLEVRIIQDRWGVPDSIRAALIKLYADRKFGLQGCVLVGDIPVVMVRDGQHMTSAFKMNQKTFPRNESSVPSDRFYDDFGLKFNLIEQDKEKPHYFFYSLRADGEQRVEPNIYSGRIRPTDVNGVSRYDKLRHFLRKAVAEKEAQTTLQKVFYFSGHGYVSDSKVCRIDEKQAIYEHFPWIRSNRDVISYMDHSDHNPCKINVMNEIMRPDLDFTIMHHHGSPDTQYFNAGSLPYLVRESIEYALKNIRSHVRKAKEKGKNYDSTKVALAQRFGLDISLLDNTFDPEVIKSDSILDADPNLTIEDFAAYGYKPNSRIVIIDGCYCGSFHQEDCIADEYIFAEGRTVAVVANSVNVLQDKWSDRFMGLVGIGGCVGDIVRFSTYLESHCIGDPTFRYKPVGESYDIDALIYEDNVAAWKKLFKSATSADAKSLAMEYLYRHNAISSDNLLKLYQDSPESLVRMEALYLLGKCNDDNMVKAIALGTEDQNEFVQRQAIKYVAQSGDERLLPSLMGVCIRNNTSERCNFNALSAIEVYPKELVEAEFARQFDTPAVCYINKDTVRAQILMALEHGVNRMHELVDEIVNPETSTELRIGNARVIRNYGIHYEFPRLIKFLRESNDTEARVVLMEALGWHYKSNKRQMILDVANEIANDASQPEELRNEALKTYNRMK